MEFIGTFLAQSKLSASNITNQSPPEPPQDVEAEFQKLRTPWGVMRAVKDS